MSILTWRTNSFLSAYISNLFYLSDPQRCQPHKGYTTFNGIRKHTFDASDLQIIVHIQSLPYN